MRKDRNYLITNANSHHWLQHPQKYVPDKECRDFALIHSVQTQWRIFIMQKGAENDQNLKLIVKTMHNNIKMKGSHATQLYP